MLREPFDLSMENVKKSHLAPIIELWYTDDPSEEVKSLLVDISVVSIESESHLSAVSLEGKYHHKARHGKSCHH